MKMVLVICPEQRRADIHALVENHGIQAFSELQGITGAGATGKKEGTRIWPGTSVLLFAIVDGEQADRLLAALKDCSSAMYPDEGVHAFVLPVEKIL